MPARRPRRGQSEVVGGLIVLTLIFMFAVPLLLNLYYAGVQAGQRAQASLVEARESLNERLALGPVDPNSEAAQRAGWIPGIWINNTGTVAVTLDKLYLIDVDNNTIFRVYDLRYARPVNTTDIKEMLMNVEEGAGQPVPPPGEPIVLQPGDTLLIVFNESLLPQAPRLVALVESASGILHPIAAGAAPQTLYPGRPGEAAAKAAWRGIFQPQSGFSLRGADELLKNGIVEAWKPGYHVLPSTRSWRDSVEDLDYTHSFIYEDPDYPGLYMVDIGLDESTFLIVYTPWGGRSVCYIPSGYTLILKGYLGTYDAGNSAAGTGTYFNGYASEIYVLDPYGNVVCHYRPVDPESLGDRGVTVLDFDGNGVDEVIVYSYLNAPTVPDYLRSNIDADADGDDLRDALAWTYMIARDISGIDYIKVTVKINYYWTKTVGYYGCPSWSVRRLKVFAVVVWRFNETTGAWDVYQYQNFGYTSEKPVQFQQTVVFPVEHNGTYRVGVIFYDNYRDFDYDYSCWTDFTMGLEHIIVEYGVYNPFFVESPPLYIVAIPDPDLIGDIGEQDYMAAKNISDVDEAKVRAQSELLSKIQEELNYAGVAGYTIITSPEEMCELLFGDQPPKYAVIYWLQGNVSISDVADEAGCTLTDADVKDYMETYHWVLVWPFGEPLGDRTAITDYNVFANLLPEGNYTLNITKPGVEVRKKFYAYYLFNNVVFRYALYWDYDGAVEDYVIVNATYYANQTDPDLYDSTTLFGTIAFWLDSGQYTGVLVLNPVHVDWDMTGDGAIPETIAQQIVYSSLTSWSILVSG